MHQHAVQRGYRRHRRNSEHRPRSGEEVRGREKSKQVKPHAADASGGVVPGAAWLCCHSNPVPNRARRVQRPGLPCNALGNQTASHREGGRRGSLRAKSAADPESRIPARLQKEIKEFPMHTTRRTGRLLESESNGKQPGIAKERGEGENLRGKRNEGNGKQPTGSEKRSRHLREIREQPSWLRVFVTKQSTT